MMNYDDGRVRGGSKGERRKEKEQGEKDKAWDVIGDQRKPHEPGIICWIRDCLLRRRINMRHGGASMWQDELMLDMSGLMASLISILA